tara:strand:- start:3182 stop:3370 length:189 start_codon:yes stop_codon:yes gene_type:complete
MTSKWVGLSDKEAFIEIFNDTVAITKFIHEHRGSMPIEDLMDSVMWKMEALTGIVPDDASGL